MTWKEGAERVVAAYARLSLLLHRRRDPRAHRPSAEALAMLEHLASTGPLTVIEAARHLDRSQSATSEQIKRIVKRGWLTRLALV